jgi:hypothetical protein
MNSEHYRIFISSPDGLERERKIILNEINDFSKRAVKIGGPGLTVVEWPKDIAAGKAMYSQDVINRQTKNLDILICVVGERMGTSTPRADSGTEEEFDRTIEAIQRGEKIEVLLFFSNIEVKPHDLDPNQIFLVHAFRERVSMIGVLYQLFNSHKELKKHLRNALGDAYDILRGHANDKNSQNIISNINASNVVEEIIFGNLKLVNRQAPQRADNFQISLAKYQRKNIRLTWKLETKSDYFRFGFKYYNSKEYIFSGGTIQTFGHNIVFHVAKNIDDPYWFKASYKGGLRIGVNTPLEGTQGKQTGDFILERFASGNIVLKLDGKMIYEDYFVFDGLPNLALLAWGDQHEFCCEVSDLKMQIQ